MPSGKRSRALREQAAAAAASPPVARRADPRVLVAAACVVVLAAVGIVLAAVLTRGGASKPVAALPNAQSANSLFRGIPQHGLLLGSPTARARMVVYIDLQCPICREYETSVMPDLVSRYVRTGKAQVELRPWAFLGPDSVRGQAALFAAAAQNRAFQFAQVLYDNQGMENTGWLTDDMLRSIATSVQGLDVSRLMRDRSRYDAAAAGVARSVAANDVNGTPTVFVGPRSGPPALGGAPGSVPTAAEVAQAIDAAAAS
jgi:protein-disulfide isomerase